MSFIRSIQSNTGSQGYRPDLSVTIKSLGVGASGYETFDLGEDWRVIDNLVVNIVNGVDSTGATTSGNFADNPTDLVSALNFPPNTLNIMGVNQTVRFSSGSSVSTIIFSVKVIARYFRIKLINGATAQSATTYIDVRCFGLTP